MAMAPSREIARRVREAECRYTATRFPGMLGGDDNPLGAELLRLGDIFAFFVKYIPSPLLNRVAGLDDSRLDDLPAILNWYAGRSRDPSIELTPDSECANVMTALIAAGYAHTGFHAVAFGSPSAASAPQAGVSIETVGNAETFDELIHAYCAGWATPNVEGFKNNVRHWLGKPNWTLYLARFEGAPAGGAILFMDGKTGYCADSAVAPQLRNRGIHQALLRRRIADTGAQGGDLVCAMATPYSTSHHNMIRAGLQTLHTKAIWTRAAGS